MRIPIHSIFQHMALLLAGCLMLPARAGAQSVSDGGMLFRVQTPGTLATLVGDARKDRLTDIAVEGALNGTDLRYLREMAGSDCNQQPTEGRLRRLDLSRATFAPGGEPYIFKDGWQTVQGGGLTLPPFAFRKCRLEQVVLPERMDTIDIGAFEHSALKSIRIPERVVVANWTFNNCNNLSQVEFPQHLVELGQNCFRDCNSLRNIRIHDVEFVPYLAFQHVTGLEELIIDGTLWHADGWVCDDCPRLQRIAFDGLVLTTGGPPIASNCPQLSEILFSGLALRINYGSVENCPMVEQCRVTGSIVDSGDHKFLPVVANVSEISIPMLRHATKVIMALNKEENRSRYSPPKAPIIQTLASILAIRGLKDEALQMLQMLAEGGSPFYDLIDSNAAYTAWKSDPEFAKVLEKIGAPDKPCGEGIRMLT